MTTLHSTLHRKTDLNLTTGSTQRESRSGVPKQLKGKRNGNK